MTRAALRPFARTALHKCVLVLTLGLAACEFAPILSDFGVDVTKSTAQFARGRLDRLWTETPGALVMVQRSGSGEGVQLIGLDNMTTLQGDNFMWLRAYDGPVNARFDLDGMVARVGGVPRPFTSLDNRNLRNATDSLGTYFWQEWRSGGATNCVIAFRRLKSGARTLPKGTRALEVFLRNCVEGSMEQALIPIRNDRVGLSTLAGTGAANRAMSPLAAPRP